MNTRKYKVGDQVVVTDLWATGGELVCGRVTMVWPDDGDGPAYSVELADDEDDDPIVLEPLTPDQLAPVSELKKIQVELKKHRDSTK